MTERVPLRLISRILIILTVLVVLLGIVVATPARSEPPAGQLTWAVHVSLAPSWFDPAETTGIITPFMFLYALHDALVKPMPGNRWRRAWPNRGRPRPTASATIRPAPGREVSQR